MGFACDIFDAIAKAIHSIVKGIVDAVKWVAQKVFEWLKGWGKWVVLGVLAFMVFAPAAFAATVAWIAGAVAKIGTIVWNVGKFVVTKLVATVKFLGSTFQSFLQAIHFKELLQLHKLAMILSKDYREMMLNVYKQISDFSQQVFGHAETVHFLIQSSRQMIYSMSTAVGYPVDIAEMEWLSTLDVTLNNLSERAEAYRDNPELVFDDLAEWVYTPLGEKYSTINQGFVFTIENLVNGLDSVAQNVFAINEQTQEVISFLPQPLRGTLQDTLRPIDQRITDFQYNIYQPKMREIDHVLRENTNRQRENSSRLSALTDELTDPRDYLNRLNDFEAPRRIESKRDINLSLEEPKRVELDDAETEIEEIVAVSDQEFDEIRIPEPTTPPPLHFTKEPKEEKIKPGIVRYGWNVGDY